MRNRTIDNSVNGNLSNLTPTGRNLAEWSNNMSNCLVEIPKDIKLELNNGTLTLKAGSKVYVPNGPGVFDEITVPADKNLTSGANWQFMVLYNKTSGIFYRNQNMSSHYSGNTAPENPVNQAIWYDTTNNSVKMYLDGAWTSDWSFPLAVITATGSISSIDQVFNGFGYIGSTIFALPGVKGLIPKGRNDNGTLKSILWTSSVAIKTFDDSTEDEIVFNGTTFEVNSRYKLENDGFLYDSSDNVVNSTFIGTISKSSGVISNFRIKTVFQALDYNEKMDICSWSMPSSKYVILTVGSSGTGYVAPANGYLFFKRRSSTEGNYIEIKDMDDGLSTIIYAADGDNLMGVFLPLRQGQTGAIYYSGTNTNDQELRFVYAEGEIL